MRNNLLIDYSFAFSFPNRWWIITPFSIIKLVLLSTKNCTSMVESENAQIFNFFAFWWPKLVFLLIVWILKDIQTIPSASFDPGKYLGKALGLGGGQFFFLGIHIYAYAYARRIIVTGSYLHWSSSRTLSTSLYFDSLKNFWKFASLSQISVKIPYFMLKKFKILLDSFPDWTKKIPNYSL